jgi:WD40-like Beta Propeller Repeat
MGLWAWLTACSLACGACSEQEPTPFSYYDERIAPILDVGCARQTTGCHQDDGQGFALGNLDLTSYDSLMRRPDLLGAYGPYPVGVLLLKAGNPVDIRVRTIDPPDPSRPNVRSVQITTDIRHGGGEGAIAQGSRNYATLKQWIDGEHRRNGVSDARLEVSRGGCVNGIGSAPGIDIERELHDARSYERFKRDVQPILKARCAGSSCHGSSLTDLHLACGDDERELRWNYEVTLAHVEQTAALSELLRRPLAMTAGGVYHEGGDIFEDVDDLDYETLNAWASDVADRAPELLEFGEADEGLRFFANRVQPVLVRKGCMFQNCHSLAMFHDLRLRGGTEGWFSSMAIRKNYEASRMMLAIDSPDPNQSRLIAKNLCPPRVSGEGITHRGGALLEDFGGCADPGQHATSSQCEDVDADQGDLDSVPAYCVLARWHELERELAVQRGELPSAELPSAVVFVTRPPGVGGVLDFDSYRPGADLVRAAASFAADGAIELAAPASLLTGCDFGASSAALDIHGIAVSWDARRIAFAARSSEHAPLRIYEMLADGSDCAALTGIAPRDDAAAGILLHDFDPAYSPDGRLVFASTRGNLDGASELRGPTRTPAALAPNANLYVYDASGQGSVRQLTYLSNQELAPSFMLDGRVIFTTEKRARDFHQLAARRQNLDGGDYHPLFAQRASVGFSAATEVVELANRNFAMVAANLDAADGGGSIVVVNRSVGPDQTDRDPRDRAFVHAITTPVPGAFGGGSGVFRSPAALPTGRLLAACDPTGSDLSAAPHRYGVCELTVTDDEPRVLWQDSVRVALEPTPLWPRAPREMFTSRPDEANGSTRALADTEETVVHYLDVPLLATLMFSNTRIGRPIEFAIEGVELFESRPAPADAGTFAELGARAVHDAFGTFYEELHSLGKAPLESDGSLRVRVPGGVPLLLGLTGRDGKQLTFREGAAFSGAMRQREETQFYPGEHAKQSMPRRLFRGMCAGCHGSLTGRELDSVVDVDVLTSASKTLAGDDLVDLR